MLATTAELETVGAATDRRGGMVVPSIALDRKSVV